VAASGAKYQVSTAGRVGPQWRGDGRGLDYVANGGVWAVPIAWSPQVMIGTPQELFRMPVATAGAIAREGQRFLLNVPAGVSRQCRRSLRC
jgi:hypothetical protein